jgi:hypothetical protein
MNAERIEELKVVVSGLEYYISDRDDNATADLLAILEDYEKVKAEVERLKGLIGSGNNELANLFLHQAGVMAELATDRCRLIAEGNCLKARAEKAEAELDALAEENAATESALAFYIVESKENGRIIKKLQTELAAARPLLEAVMKAEVYSDESGRATDYTCDGFGIIEKAALAYREGKEKP